MSELETHAMSPHLQHQGAFEAHPTGSFIGRYQIVRRVGTGGMGAVYEAMHVDLEKRVALKVLRAEFAANGPVRARFLREARAASRIRHPHVADVTDVGEHEGVPFLVMEFLDGEDLSAMLQREAPFSPELTADLMLPVIAAMHAAHDEGVVHRDLKPANIFLARDRYGQVVPKVVDFGVSKIVEPMSQELTGTEALLGTPYYMAPEQVEGARHTGPASDQFALGVILYCCLTRQLPFRGESAFATMRAIVDGAYTPATRLVPGLAPELDWIIARAMAPRPGGRYPTLLELGAELLAFASSDVQTRWRPVFAPSTLVRPATMPPPRRPVAAPVPLVATSAPYTPPPTPMPSTQAPYAASPAPLPSFTSPSTLTTATRPVLTAPPPRRSAARAVAVIAALGVAAAAGYVLLGRTPPRPIAPVAAAPSEAPSARPVAAPPLAAPPVVAPPLAAPPVVAAPAATPTVAAPPVAAQPVVAPPTPSRAPRPGRPRPPRPQVEQTRNGGTIIR